MGLCLVLSCAATALGCMCMLWPAMSSTTPVWQHGHHEAVTRGGFPCLASILSCLLQGRVPSDTGRGMQIAQLLLPSLRDGCPSYMCVLLVQEELSNALILVYANKQVRWNRTLGLFVLTDQSAQPAHNARCVQDIPGALSDAQVAEGLGLTDIKNRDWSIFKTSAIKGTGALTVLALHCCFEQCSVTDRQLGSFPLQVSLKD